MFSRDSLLILNISFLAQQNTWLASAETIHLDEKVWIEIISFSHCKHGFEDEIPLTTSPRQVGKTAYLKLLVMDLLDYSKVHLGNIHFLTCDFID